MPTLKDLQLQRDHELPDELSEAHCFTCDKETDTTTDMWENPICDECKTIREGDDAI